MCVSSQPAELAKTRIAVWDAPRDEAGGRVVRHLAYANQVKNLAEGPNAMLLHIPAPGLGRANVNHSEDFPHFLDDLLSPPLPRSAPHPAAAMAEVFELGSVYTVVMAGDARTIPAALKKVAKERRPIIDPALMDWYAENFPARHWSIMLCCFNNRDAMSASPIIVWFDQDPIFSGRIIMPAIDAHSGGLPDLDSRVLTDHALGIGALKPLGPYLVSVQYRHTQTRPVPWLPRNVVRAGFNEVMPNGDFVLDELDWQKPPKFRRAHPTDLIT